MGSLKCAWDVKEVPIATKINMCQEIPMNLASWESINWSGDKVDLAMM